jgi:hypothetical protein
MVRVALDLGGPAHVAFDQDADAGPAERHGACIEQRPAGDDLIGRMNIGHQVDRRRRPHRTTAQAGQGQRSAHQGQKLPPAERIRPDRGLFRELAPHQFLEGRRIGQLLQAAPVALTPLALQSGQRRAKILASAHWPFPEGPLCGPFACKNVLSNGPHSEPYEVHR